MVVVTGTMRSGTSLWMRMLIDGGLPHLGERFPARWAEALPTANPEGFWESRFRVGVYFATNPDPESGAYLPAGATTRHAVKIFVPGVIRTERAYLHRVVATLRGWRPYTRSRARLEAEEDAWLRANPPAGADGEAAVARAHERRGRVPTPIAWFLENYELVRDWSARRYPIHFTTYERLLEAPGPTVATVFAWIGLPDPERAAARVDPALRRAPALPPVPAEAALRAEDAALFDAFHDAVHRDSSLPKSLVDDLNAAWRRLAAEHGRTPTRDA